MEQIKSTSHYLPIHMTQKVLNSLIQSFTVGSAVVSLDITSLPNYVQVIAVGTQDSIHVFLQKSLQESFVETNINIPKAKANFAGKKVKKVIFYQDYLICSLDSNFLVILQLKDQKITYKGCYNLIKGENTTITDMTLQNGKLIVLTDAKAPFVSKVFVIYQIQKFIDTSNSNENPNDLIFRFGIKDKKQPLMIQYYQHSVDAYNIKTQSLLNDVQTSSLNNMDLIFLVFYRYIKVYQLVDTLTNINGQRSSIELIPLGYMSPEIKKIDLTTQYTSVIKVHGNVLMLGDRTGRLSFWNFSSYQNLDGDSKIIDVTLIFNPFHSTWIHSKAIRGIDFCNMKLLAFSLDRSGAIACHNMQSGEVIKKWIAHSGDCALMLQADKGILVTYGADCNVKLWKVWNE